MFETIFNTIMDLKEKTKDNMKAIIDIPFFYHHKNIELVYDKSWVVKPKVSFILNKNTHLFIYQWLKCFCFHDGKASNISRLVNLKDCILYTMKSHDYHVFMQTFFLLTYHTFIV
jgi:hypothetical protein